DKTAGILVVDRFLYTSMRYPGNYGFIPHTLSEDGDPCDVLVVNTRAITPGALMSVRPIGALLMEDEAGPGAKIIAVPSSRLTRRYDTVKSYADLPEITLQQVQHFFEHYKDLKQHKWVKVARWGGPDEAHRLILEACARARQQRPRASERLRVRLRPFETPPPPHILGPMSSRSDDSLVRPDPADPRLTERVRGVDQTGAPVETAVTVERALTIFLNAQEIVTAMTINDYPEYLALGYL